MTNATNVPDGYMKDPQGRLVPTSTIRPLDLERDHLVQKIVAQGRKVSAEITAFKAETFGDIQAFAELSAEQYGVTLGGKKGNLSLLSFDGRHKVTRAFNDNIVFDERLQAAKALIDRSVVFLD